MGNKAFRKKMIKSNLHRYYRRVKVSLYIFAALIIFLFSFSLERISLALKGIKKLRQVVETKLFNVEEKLEFENAQISLNLESEGKNYLLFAKLHNNISKKFRLIGKNEYIMNKLSLEVFASSSGVNNIMENWEERIQLTSNFASLQEDGVKIYDKVIAFYYTKINPKFDNTVILTDEVTLFKERKAEGINLKINGSEGEFKLDIFKINFNLNIGQFEGNILLETLDYKIMSQKLIAKMASGELETLFFTKQVKFIEKDGKKTIVTGENALFDNAKSEILIYGDVLVQSGQNNLKIKADSFTYNEKTKKGYFKASDATQRQLEVELDI